MLATILVASNLAMSANYTWCEPTTDHGCFDDKGQQGGYGWKGKGSRRVVARQYFFYNMVHECFFKPTVLPSLTTATFATFARVLFMRV